MFFCKTEYELAKAFKGNEKVIQLIIDSACVTNQIERKELLLANK